MAQFTGLTISGTANDDIVDALIALNRSLEYQMSGNLDSGNILEVGGWRVGATELTSKDMDVGMSTDDSMTNPVRFWAGRSQKDSAPWRVHHDGTMFAVGATLVSQDGAYPRMELGGKSHLFTAYSSPSEYLQINAYHFGESVPSLGFYSGQQSTFMMQYPQRGFVLHSFGHITISPGGFFGTTYLNGLIDVESFSTLLASSDGSQSLQDILNNLQSQIDGKASIDHTHE